MHLFTLSKCKYLQVFHETPTLYIHIIHMHTMYYIYISVLGYEMLQNQEALTKTFIIITLNI